MINIPYIAKLTLSYVGTIAKKVSFWWQSMFKILKRLFQSFEDKKGIFRTLAKTFKNRCSRAHNRSATFVLKKSI